MQKITRFLSAKRKGSREGNDGSAHFFVFPISHWKTFFICLISLPAHFPSVEASSIPIPAEADTKFTVIFEEALAINRTDDGYSYLSFQQSIQCTAPFPPIKPKTLTEIQDIIHYALMKKHHVKVIGSLHSTTDIICTDGLVVDMANINHFSFDPQTNLATVGAGAELQDFMSKLDKRGRALTSSPSYGGVTIGGAIGTGAHGTTLKRAATISDQVVSITFVDGVGSVRTVRSGEEDFKAFKVNLGLLGIIYEVVFETTEQYKLEVRNFPISDEILWTSGEIIAMAEATDMFQFYWFPTNKQIVMSFGNIVPTNMSGNCETHYVTEFSAVNAKSTLVSLELMQATGDDVGFFFAQSYNKMSLFKEVPGRTPMFTKADGYTACLPVAVGYSHRMMANRCRDCFWGHGEFAFLLDDASISIPLRELPAALKTIRDILDLQLTGFPLNGIWIRFLKGSDAYLGGNNGRDTAVIDWNTVPRFDRTQPKLGITAYQAMGQALIERHGGRPHWGKNGLHYSSPNIIQRFQPDLNKFREVMKKMDPHEVFVNDFGRRLKHGSNEMTLSKEAALRCGLNDACLCKDDADCGNGGALDFICDELMEFRVCKKRPNPLDDLKDIVSRNVIKLAADLSNNVDYILSVLGDYKGFGNKK